MTHLTTFGGPGLCDAVGNRIDTILAQPRRLALLIYLAVETRKSRLRRDVVLGMFWPDVSQERASRSLSQAMLFLRKRLGANVLSEPGCDEVFVNPEELACDVCTFLSAVESGRHAEAVALYSGDFLRGFYVDDAPDFEQWAEEQRLYLRRVVSESAMAEARRMVAQSQTVGAAAYARRAAELGLFAEPLVREQMELLGSVGDGAGALEAYEQLRRRLRSDFEIEPSLETEKLAERLRTRTAQQSFSAAVAAPASPEPTHAVVGANTPATARKDRPSAAVLAVATVVFGVAMSLWGLTRAQPDRLALETPVVLIEDFADVGAAVRGVGEAITSDVIGNLSRVSGLAAKYVTSPLGDPNEAGDSDPLVLKGYVSAGTAPGSYRVSVTLLNGVTGESVAYRIFPYDSTEFAAFDRVAADIADFTRVQAGRYYRTERLADMSPENASAIRLAQEYRVRGDSMRGEDKVEPSLAAFAAADSLIATLQDKKRPAAMLLSERAEIWQARAWVFLTLPGLDLRQFRASMMRSLTLADSAVLADPRSASGYENRGAALYFLWQMEPADSFAKVRRLVSISETALRTAVEIAPARARSWALLSTILHVGGRFAEARLAAERAYTANAFLQESSDVLQRLFFSSLETGDPNAAKTWCDEIGRRYGDSWLHAHCEVELIAWSQPTAAQFVAAQKAISNQQAAGRAPQLLAHLEMTLGVIAAAVGMPVDSALNIQRSAMVKSPSDPELAPARAWLWRTVNRPDSARAVLDSYVSADPHRRSGVAKSARFNGSRPLLASSP